MINIDAVKQFKEQSTWRLLGLGLITYGLYFAYYIRKQTIKLNSVTDPENAISSILVDSILATSYICIVLFLTSLFANEAKFIDAISRVFDLINALLVIAWGFKARHRANSIFKFTPNDRGYLRRLWTFLFSPMYFNYKINSIYETHSEDVTNLKEDNSNLEV